MAKFIYRGFNPRGDMISSQPFAITGANLRKSSGDKTKAAEDVRVQTATNINADTSAPRWFK